MSDRDEGMKISTPTPPLSASPTLGVNPTVPSPDTKAKTLTTASLFVGLQNRGEGAKLTNFREGDLGVLRTAIQQTIMPSSCSK